MPLPDKSPDKQLINHLRDFPIFHKPAKPPPPAAAAAGNVEGGSGRPPGHSRRPRLRAPEARGAGAAAAAQHFPWHQDGTYWGLEPTDGAVSCWVALADASSEDELG